MAIFFIGRTVDGPDEFGQYTINDFFYNTVTELVTNDSFGSSSSYDEVIPELNEVLYSECDASSLKEWTYEGGLEINDPNIDLVTTADSPSCCSINSSDFIFEVTGDNGTNNGTIKITSGTVNVEDYEASLDGAAYVPGASSQILFEDLLTGTHSVRVRLINGSCFFTASIFIPSTVVDTPFGFNLESPSQFMPVFWPIAYTGEFTGNEVDIKQNGAYTVIETNEASLQSYLLAIILSDLPGVRIYGSENYDGVYKVIQALSSTQYVIDASYVSDEAVTICPSEKQTFLLYCERGFNQFIKIAEISSAAGVDGQFNIRVEGFLQSEFEVNPPVEGDEITLGRKYYLLAQDYSITTDITTAVYSAIESLTPFLEDLVPLGPAPMNFVNEQTQKGLPVLFSYLNTATGRVVNIISSKETSIISTNDISILALPCNQYSIEWIKVAGNINGSVVVNPALPSWITATVQDDRIFLEINTCEGQGGDYEPDDYLSDDYLTAGFNALVGCYEFGFSDDDGVLFNLSICIYPIQQPANEVCEENAYNIAWVNREGGWSSYPFASDRGDRSKKTSGVDIGSSTDYKRNGELKKSSVEDIYDTATVLFSNKGQRDLIFIASLRKSIQAFLWNELTRAWDIPIFIDVDSFPTYSVPFNQAVDGNGAFTFRYSDEVRIQRQ